MRLRAVRSLTPSSAAITATVAVFSACRPEPARTPRSLDDCSGLVPFAHPRGRWGPRVQVDATEETYDIPEESTG
jgi:hypothetical protein